MNKLRLDVDTLRVEAFETLPTPAERGTVAGRAAAAGTIFWPFTLLCTRPEDATCYEDCTTRGEDLSCAPGCESMTINAVTCPECAPAAQGADTVAVIG